MSEVQSAMSGAVRTLQAIMDDPDASASARVSAAKAVLDFGVRTLEVEDLEDRIRNIEKATERWKP